MTVDASAHRPAGAAGPLVVSRENPRYFTIAAGDAAAGRAVYLSGSHIWNNFHDGMGPGPSCAQPPERFDYDAYVKFLKERGHNFIRLWRWEQFRSQAASTYTVEWYSVKSRETREGSERTVERDGRESFTSPFAAGGPAVLYLKQAGR